MSLCKLCFQKVRDGVPVPGYKEASGTVHEECLAAVALNVAQDPQKEGLLRYLIDYEEKHAPYDWAKDVSGGSADVCWDWKQVGVPFSKLHPLLNAGLISIVFSTNSGTDYALVGRDVIKEALGRSEEGSLSPHRSAGYGEVPLPDGVWAA
jgi:hypothetical protein